MMCHCARYVLRDDHPFCIRCYENAFANNCDDCGKVIGIDSKVPLIIIMLNEGKIQILNIIKDLSYKEKHWHEACFRCTKCNSSLVDKQFGSKADRSVKRSLCLNVKHLDNCFWQNLLR